MSIDGAPPEATRPSIETTATSTSEIATSQAPRMSHEDRLRASLATPSTLAVAMRTGCGTASTETANCLPTSLRRQESFQKILER